MAGLQTGPKRVLVACALGLAFGYSAIGLVSFGVFVGPLSEEFGWGRGDMSLGLTLMSIVIVILSPVAGGLIDRFGVRRVLLPSIAGFGLALTLLSQLNGSLYQYYGLYILLAVAGVCTTPASYSRVIVAWFDRHRGLALGGTLAGIGAGTALIPLLVANINTSLGWRYSFISIAAIVLLVSLPVVWMWIAEPARQIGQQAMEVPAEL